MRLRHDSDSFFALWPPRCTLASTPKIVKFHRIDNWHLYPESNVCHPRTTHRTLYWSCVCVNLSQYRCQAYLLMDAYCLMFSTLLQQCALCYQAIRVDLGLLGLRTGTGEPDMMACKWRALESLWLLVRVGIISALGKMLSLRSSL